MQQPSGRIRKHKSLGSARIFQQSIQGIETRSPEERRLSPDTTQDKESEHSVSENKDSKMSHLKSNGDCSSQQGQSDPDGKPNDRFAQEHLSGPSPENQCSTGKKTSIKKTGIARQLQSKGVAKESLGEKLSDSAAESWDSVGMSNPPGGQNSGSGEGDLRQEMDHARSSLSQEYTLVTETRYGRPRLTRGPRGRSRHFGREQQNAEQASANSVGLGRGSYEGSQPQKPGLSVPWRPVGKSSSDRGCSSVVQPSGGDSSHGNNAKVNPCQSSPSLSYQSLEISCGAQGSRCCQQQQAASSVRGNGWPPGANSASAKSGSGRLPSLKNCERNGKAHANTADKFSELTGINTASNNSSQRNPGHERGKMTDRREGKQTGWSGEQKFQACSSNTSEERRASEGKTKKKHKQKSRKYRFGGKNISQCSSLSTTSLERSDVEKEGSSQQRMDGVVPSLRNVDNKVVAVASTTDSGNCQAGQRQGLSKSQPVSQLGPRKPSAELGQRPNCPPRFARWSHERQDSGQGHRQGNRQQLPQQRSWFGLDSGSANSSMNKEKLGRVNAGSSNGTDVNFSRKLQIGSPSAASEKGHGQDAVSLHCTDTQSSKSGSISLQEHDSMQVNSEMKMNNAESQNKYENQKCNQIEKFGCENATVQQSRKTAEKVSNPDKESIMRERNWSSTSSEVSNIKVLTREDVMLTSQDYRMHELPPGFTMLRYQVASPPRSVDHGAALHRDTTDSPSMELAPKGISSNSMTEERQVKNGHMPEDPHDHEAMIWNDEISQSQVCKASSSMAPNAMRDGCMNEDAGLCCIEEASADNVPRCRENNHDGEGASHASKSLFKPGLVSCSKSVSRSAVYDQYSGTSGSFEGFPAQSKSDTLIESKKTGSSCGRGIPHTVDVPYPGRCRVQEDDSQFPSPSASTQSTCFLSTDDSWEAPLQPGLACQLGGGMAQRSGRLVTEASSFQAAGEHGCLNDEKQSKPPATIQADGGPISRVQDQTYSGRTAERGEDNPSCKVKAMKVIGKSSQPLQAIDSSSGVKWDQSHDQHGRGQATSHQFSDTHTRSDLETPALAVHQHDGHGAVMAARRQNRDPVPNQASCTDRKPVWPKMVVPASITTGTFETYEICTDAETQHASAFANSTQTPSFSCSMLGSDGPTEVEPQAPSLEVRNSTSYCERESFPAEPLEKESFANVCTNMEVCGDPPSSPEEVLASLSRGRGRRQQVVQQDKRVTSSSSSQSLQAVSFREAHEKEMRFLQGAGSGVPGNKLSQNQGLPRSSRNASPKSIASQNHGGISHFHQTCTRKLSQHDEDLLWQSPSGIKKCAPTVGFHGETHLENFRTGREGITDNDDGCQPHCIASWMSSSPPRTTDLQDANGASHTFKLHPPSLPKCSTNHEETSVSHETISGGFNFEQPNSRQHCGKAVQTRHPETPQNYAENEISSGDDYVDPPLGIFSDSGDAQSQSPLKSDRNHPFKHSGDFCLYRKSSSATSTNRNSNLKQPKSVRTQTLHSTTSVDGECDSWRQSKRAEMRDSTTQETLNLRPAGLAYESFVDCASTSGYSVDTEGERSLDTGSQEDLDLDWRQTCSSFPRPLFLHQTLRPRHWDRNPGSSQPFSPWQDGASSELPRACRPSPGPSGPQRAHQVHHLYPHKVSPVQHPSTWSFTLEGCQAEAEVNNLLWQVKACLQPQRSQSSSINVVNFQVVPNESGLDMLIRKKCVPWDTPQSEWWRHGPIPGMNPRTEWSHTASQHTEWSRHSPTPSRNPEAEQFHPGTPPPCNPLPMPKLSRQQQTYPDWLLGFGERYPTGRCQTDMPDREDARALNTSAVHSNNSSLEDVRSSTECPVHHRVPSHPAPDSTLRHDHTASPGASGGTQSQLAQPCYCVTRSSLDACSCSAPLAHAALDTTQGPRPGRKRPPSQMSEGEGLPSHLPRREPSQDWWSPPSDKEDCCYTPKAWQQQQQQHSPRGHGEGNKTGDVLKTSAPAWFLPVPGTWGSVYATPPRPSVFASSPHSRGAGHRMPGVTAAMRLPGCRMPQPSPGHSSRTPCYTPGSWRQQSMAMQSLDQKSSNEPLNSSDLTHSNNSTVEMGEVEPETSLRWKTFCSDLQRRCQRYTVSFVDSHCHLDFIFSREPFQGSFWNFCQRNRDSMPSNFEGCISIFCNPSSFNPKVGLWLRLAQESNVWLAFGCHPKQASGFDPVLEQNLAEIVRHPRVVAVGEMGLDFSKQCFVRQAELQKQVFRRQIELALAVGKPLIIHSRDAEDESLAILTEMVPRHYKIHCHCFTASWEKACQWLEAFPNLCLGLTPLVTFRSATSTRHVARQIPLNRLLLETDSPYFVPQSVPRECMRLSHPGMAIFVAEEVANLKSISVNEVLAACRKNTRDLFGI